MGGLPEKIIIITIITVFQCSSFAFEYESPADNPRLVNITPKQKHSLAVIEKRIYGNSFEFENTVDRVERLEIDFFDQIQKGTITERIKTLRVESTRAAISGTAMTPMMQSTFNTRYVNAHADVHPYNDVGIIDGLIREWWPDLYAQLCEYRRYKEANFY